MWEQHDIIAKNKGPTEDFKVRGVTSGPKWGCWTLDSTNKHMHDSTRGPQDSMEVDIKQ